jgi:hypothetical protein
MTANSTSGEVLPPQGLFRIQGWNRYKDWGKTIAMMGWMQFWSYKIFQQFFVRFWFLPKCHLWVSIQTVLHRRLGISSSLHVEPHRVLIPTCWGPLISSWPVPTPHDDAGNCSVLLIITPCCWPINFSGTLNGCGGGKLEIPASLKG